MMKLLSPIVLLASIGALSGCAYLTLPPVANDDRTVTPVAGRKQRVVVKEPMVWGDQRPLLTRGIGFPTGVYVLEAEDSKYWYFRSPKPLEYRTYRQGQPPGERFKKGGLFLSKSPSELIPAGAYAAGDDSTKKTLIWMLGDDFLRGEGSKWTKNF
jgi:hypothetical protein